jgi:CheY-like chemotaxis protein
MSEAGGGFVMIVEDDADIRESLETTLAMVGHKVTTAADGVEALTLLRQDPAHPCLILLDLMMPNMNGFELMETLTADPSLRTIPVVIITGAGVAVDRHASEIKSEVLRKPFARSVLLDTVGRFCPKRDSTS